MGACYSAADLKSARLEAHKIKRPGPKPLPNPVPKVEPKVEPKLESKLEPKVEPKLEPEPEHVLEPVSMTITVRRSESKGCKEVLVAGTLLTAILLIAILGNL